MSDLTHITGLLLTQALAYHLPELTHDGELWSLSDDGAGGDADRDRAGVARLEADDPVEHPPAIGRAGIEPGLRRGEHAHLGSVGRGRQRLIDPVLADPLRPLRIAADGP